MSQNNNGNHDKFLKEQLQLHRARRQELQNWSKEYDKKDIAPLCLIGVNIDGKFFVNFHSNVSPKEIAQVLMMIAVQMAANNTDRTDVE